MSYRDTSALAKLYLSESDSAAFEALCRCHGPLSTARLTDYGLRAMLMRKEADGTIAHGEAESSMLLFEGDVILENITIHDESENVSLEYEFVLNTCYTQSPPVFVRTADAIHIATALAAGETGFVTADARQRKAAEVCGLTVFP